MLFLCIMVFCIYLTSIYSHQFNNICLFQFYCTLVFSTKSINLLFCICLIILLFVYVQLLQYYNIKQILETTLHGPLGQSGFHTYHRVKPAINIQISWNRGDAVCKPLSNRVLTILTLVNSQQQMSTLKASVQLSTE